MIKDIKYYHTDIESGQTYEVTKEQHEAIKKLWNCAKPVMKVTTIGRLVIFGIGGNFEKDFSSMLWNEPIKGKKILPVGKLKRAHFVGNEYKSYMDEIGNVFKLDFRTGTRLYSHSVFIM